MELPALNAPERYTGLYVFDFGDRVAVGYTAEEVAMLLSVDQYARGTAYRIHRATPDGTIELVGVSAAQLKGQETMRFLRAVAGEARADFERLRALAVATPPPCPVRLCLIEQAGAPLLHATVIEFPTVESEGVSHWLRDGDFRGGDAVEASNGLQRAAGIVLKRVELSPASTRRTRSREAVLAATHEAVQR